MAKKKTTKKGAKNTKSSYYPEPGESLPTFSYAFMGDTCYLLLGGNRAKIRWNKRRIPASVPFYCLPSKIGFDSDYSKEYNMKVGDEIWEVQYDDAKDISGGIYLVGHYDEIFDNSNPDVVTFEGGETRGEYVITAIAPGTATLKLTRVYAGNIRYSATCKVTVTPVYPILSFDYTDEQHVSGEMEPIMADENGNVVLPQPTFTHSEDTHFEYYSFSDTPDVHYQPGDTVTITEDITITAHFETPR